MVSEQEYTRHEGLEIAFFVLLGVFMTIVLPLVFGFGLKGFEESFVAGRPLQFGDILTSFLIYYILILGALFGGIAFGLVKILTIKKGQHPATQDNPNISRIFSVSLIHDPEDGALYTLFRKMGMSQKKNFMRWSISIARMFAVAIIFFGFLGLLSLSFPQLQIVSIPGKVLQQITPATQVYFTAEPPAFAETGIMLAVFMLLMGIVAYLVAKYKLGITMYYVIGFILVSPLIGLLWYGFHNIVYQNSAQAHFSTFIFGWIGSSLTLLLGSFIFWYVWHFMNNFFAGLVKVAPGNTDVTFYVFLFLVLFSVSFIVIELLAYKRRKRKSLEVQEPSY